MDLPGKEKWNIFGVGEDRNRKDQMSREKWRKRVWGEITKIRGYWDMYVCKRSAVKTS